MLLFARVGAHEPAAVLLGAREAAGTATAAFGDDARRLAEAARHLESAVGPATFAAATARGSEMSGDEAVGFARWEVEHARSSHG